MVVARGRIRMVDAWMDGRFGLVDEISSSQVSLVGWMGFGCVWVVRVSV